MTVTDAAPDLIMDQIMSRAGSRLGFGCGNLHADENADASLRLLETALDAGVTWFDVARLYGEGEAEGLLGKAIKGRRDGLVIVSKAGILPTPNGLHLRAADKAARLARRLPGLGALVAEPAPRSPVFGVFDPAALRRSVETSLRNLGVDNLDLLLLHECTLADASRPELVDLLETLKLEGKIAAWGSAAVDAEALAIAQAAPPGLSAMQFPHTVLEPVLPAVRAHTGVLAIVHSLFSGEVRRFLSDIATRPQLADKARALGIDPADTRAMGVRLMALALRENRGGVVLFSTSNPGAIAANLAAASIPAHEADAMLALAAAWKAGG
ncbi:MAG: aldo/keto reductase [Hyphomonadaceae bacterium]